MQTTHGRPQRCCKWPKHRHRTRDSGVGVTRRADHRPGLHTRRSRLIPEDLLCRYEQIFPEYAADLRRLRCAALAGRGARARHPRQLLADLPDFTGRDSEVATLLDTVGSARPVVLWGAPGLGKISAAVHAAHLLLDQYLDGHLYADLTGTDGTAAEPSAVLRHLLRSLGTAGAHPQELGQPGLAELAAEFRSACFGRRLLLLLDNATDERQVRPVLPADTACLTLVTSRSPLSGLDGANRLRLGPLAPAEGMDPTLPESRRGGRAAYQATGGARPAPAARETAHR